MLYHALFSCLTQQLVACTLCTTAFNIFHCAVLSPTAFPPQYKSQPRALPHAQQFLPLRAARAFISISLLRLPQHSTQLGKFPIATMYYLLFVIGALAACVNGGPTGSSGAGDQTIVVFCIIRLCPYAHLWCFLCWLAVWRTLPYAFPHPRGHFFHLPAGAIHHLLQRTYHFSPQTTCARVRRSCAYVLSHRPASTFPLRRPCISAHV